MAATALLMVPSRGHGFTLSSGGMDLREAPRWSAEDYFGTGLHDGIQVAVMPGMAEALEVAPENVPLFEQTILDAFGAWENGALQFWVSFDGPAVQGVAIGQGLEIDLFAVPGSAPPFSGGPHFGATSSAASFVTDRLLTNGQRASGNVITGADIFINIDNLLAFRDQYGLNIQQQSQAIQRLLMHEIGHALGLGHPNEGLNLDTDDDPLNAMTIDPCDWEADIDVSPNVDDNAVMSNDPSDYAALFFTALRNDDLGGRDLLYPVAPPGQTCPPLPPPTPPLGKEDVTVIIDFLGDGLGNELRNPGGPVLTPSGEIYVPGYTSDNVFEIASDGTVSEILDASGDGAGAFLDAPSALAVGPQGRIYVVGLASDNAFRVDLDGTVSEILDASGDGLGSTMDQPSSVAADIFGNLYVGASVSQNVFRIDADGSVQQVLDPSYGRPVKIVADDLGNVYIATSNFGHSVYKIDPEGEVTTVLGPEGADGATLVMPTSMAVDSAQNIYVAGRDNIFRITPDGQASFLFDRNTPGPEMLVEGYIWLGVDDIGNIYAAAQQSLFILRRSPLGEFEKIFVGQPLEIGGYGRIGVIAAKGAGDLYIPRPEGHVVIYLEGSVASVPLLGAPALHVLALGLALSGLWLVRRGQGRGSGSSASVP